jgi:hypothetical protein
MVGVKKVIVEQSKLLKVGEELLKEYRTISVFAAGSEEHSKAGLSADKVLIRAYNKRKS